MNSLTTFAAAALVLFAFGQAIAAKAAEPTHGVMSIARSVESPGLR